MPALPWLAKRSPWRWLWQSGSRGVCADTIEGATSKAIVSNDVILNFRVKNIFKVESTEVFVRGFNIK
jgi:hypothetical protein